jgi:hypothetical protein
MIRKSTSLVPWSAAEVVKIPSSAAPQDLVQYANHHLSPRDMKSIVAAFQNESYEMVATFVWSKASAVLKKQIATLGMDFVGEMLGRQDLNEYSDPATSIADYEAIRLAEDLALIKPTQALRLKNALNLINHFTALDLEASGDELMDANEATSILRYCIDSILGRPSFDVAFRFAEFRKKLTEKTFKPDDGDVTAITTAPYFFLRTTLSVLLSLVKTAKGASQEHALGNLNVLLPELWDGLREPEKWQIGQAYAEVNAEGNRVAATGIKNALLKVHGFDFVPESLRSNTFSEAAARVLAAHFAYQNFYNEREPMEMLAALGTAIPKPAFANCMEATLAVYLGNYWGHTWAAQPAAKSVFDSLRTEQWEYYLNECLRRDRTVLDKLSSDDKPTKRWVRLVEEYNLPKFKVREQIIAKLLKSTASRDLATIQQQAKTVRLAVESLG